MALIKRQITFIICALNIILLLWLAKIPFPRLSHDDKYFKQLRGIGERNIVSNVSHADALNTVVIIGHDKNWKHKYPINCECEGSKYLVTNNSAFLQTARILVSAIGIKRNNWPEYLGERKMSQIWVLGTRESPQTNTGVLPPVYIQGKVYNWSFTYHSKADFPTPYGGYKKFKEQRFVTTNWFSQKNNLITWTSSHCPLPAYRYQRREFVFSLKEHLNISVFGKCGDGKFYGQDYKKMMTSFKFALVLENSCCSEYITEKFWDALTLYNQVPVVYGATRKEYERIAPPGSFIFIQDFSSLNELAEYVNKVGNDEFEYNKYHYWKNLGYTYKQNIKADVIYHCHSICRMASKLKEVEEGNSFNFNENGEVYFGGCRKCQEEIDLVTSDAFKHMT